MVPRCRRYDLLAGLFDYPDEECQAKLQRCAGALADGYAGPAVLLEPLLEKVRELSVEQAQEMFTRTFDINPVCTLEIGWHIYGEDYARGAFLVKMREQLREWNLPESRELPDHLTHVLALLGRLEGEAADQLAARYILPALEKMLDGMKDSDSPYKEILQAVSQVVGQDHDVEVVAPQQRRSEPPGWGARLPIFNAQGRAGT